MRRKEVHEAASVVLCHNWYEIACQVNLSGVALKELTLITVRALTPALAILIKLVSSSFLAAKVWWP